MTAVLQQIALVANGLTKAELHVLIQLAARADSGGALVAMASSRELAEATDLARASVQAAIDSLNAKRLITSSGGSATQPAAHRLDCLEAAVENKPSGLTVEPQVAQLLGQGGLKTGPGVAQMLSQGGLTLGPGVAQILSQGGPIMEPVVAQNLGQSGPTVEPPSNVESSTCEHPHIERVITHADSIDKKIDKTIDRLQNAKKGDYDEALFELARTRIASHHAKYAREENRQPNLPDDTITARFLSIAEWPRLESLLLDLASERKEGGHSYAWYVTVALQRVCGISPSRWRQRQSEIKKVLAASGPEMGNPTVVARLRSLETTPDRQPASRLSPEMLRRKPDQEEFRRQIRELATSRSL